jgi:hypothetical protein
LTNGILYLLRLQYDTYVYCKHYSDEYRDSTQYENVAIITEPFNFTLKDNLFFSHIFPRKESFLFLIQNQQSMVYDLQGFWICYLQEHCTKNNTYCNFNFLYNETFSLFITPGTIFLTPGSSSKISGRKVGLSIHMFESSHIPTIKV